MSQIYVEGGHLAKGEWPIDMITVCGRCGSQAPIGRAVTLIPGEPYFIRCYRQSKCSVPFPDLPAGWAWQKLKGCLYIGLSPKALARQDEEKEEAAARQHAAEQARKAQLDAAKAQKDFFTRGKGARRRNRLARSLVGLFQNFRDLSSALERRKLITRQELLTEGWTAREIEQLLEGPDEIETWRHRGASGSRYLYRRDRVEAVPRPGNRRFSIRTSKGACVLVLSNDQRVWIEPYPAGAPIGLAREIEQALEAAAMFPPCSLDALAVWRPLVENLVERDQDALARLCAPVRHLDKGSAET